MNKLKKVISASILLNILLLTILVGNMFYINELETWKQDEIDGKHDPIEIESYYSFHVDKEFPLTQLIIIEDGVKRVVGLDTESNEISAVGSSCYLEWLVLNYTIDIQDWTWEYWNGTHWIEEYAWFINYTNWISVYEGSLINHYHSDNFNITLLSEVVF